MASDSFQYGQLEEDLNQISGLKSLVLEGRYRHASFGLAISLFVTGLISSIIGGIGYMMPGYETNFSIVIGQDVWIGLINARTMYYENTTNPNQAATLQQPSGQPGAIIMPSNRLVNLNQETSGAYTILSEATDNSNS
ncbi:uncharacterized protein TRIADDRAFT_61152 [Trichoplax adhaerens]|uniref:Uncharacterized protein n=1 Tax=Trichoplax adhaerens TaxID=10228 RepID=B3SA67_TRIAD|nr:predicted protein [Trichoplax adhaerens]EDV20383.1 predicted protein [Trichoplax adhaerens]|eukprot:XP_002117077.1 predicted protein [Trichoplax adhaerens]